VDQQYGVHVGPDVIQQTRDECCRIDSDSHTRNHCSLLDVQQAYMYPQPLVSEHSTSVLFLCFAKALQKHCF
jgi:hypothetical protein